ncbi:MAG: C40 family peptidase, partial [Acidimicrobiales bacterium]
VGVRLAAPVVGITMAPDSHGYWLVAGDGGIFSYGSARFYGSTGNIRLNRPVIGMAATPDGGGYWLFASDGGVFSFGDARFYGSTGNVRLNAPVIGMAASPNGGGYWLFASDGGIFTFGDATFHGSTGNIRLNRPVTSMTPTPDGHGYWLVGADGGVFTFGDAPFLGSLGNQALGQSVSRLVASGTGAGSGYWEITHSGDVHGFGSAAFSSPPVMALMHTIESPGDVAMEFAMSKLGVPYVWGGNGPYGYDCSGLTMAAWRAAGVSIPRVANSQYISGAKVDPNQLVDGDLVFWANNTADPNSVEHVAMYIGGGHMVNAPYPGQVVRTDWIGGGGFMALGTHP